MLRHQVRRCRHVAPLPFLALVGGLVALTACKKQSGGAREDLALAPKDTTVVFMANLTRMRSTAMWHKIEDLRDHDDASKKDYAEFVQRCALDPLKQIDSVFLAVPEVAGDSREFAAIVRGTFNEAKLVQCATDQAKKEGGDVVVSEYAGHKLYNDAKQGVAFATFLDKRTAVIGSASWIRRVIDLSAGKDAGQSAKSNDALVALMKRTKTSDAMWGCGVVPQRVRDNFKADPNLAAMSSMKTVFGSVDFANGFAMDLSVDTGGDADAKELVSKVNAQIAEARKNSQVMLMGLQPIIDGVKTEAKGPTFRLAVSYNQQQVDDLISRVKGLLSSFGSALGGAGAALPKNP
jgi:hypothetical protein